MTHDYTPNMLVKFIYGETDLFETLEIENAMEENYELKESYNILRNGYNELPKIEFSPSDAAVNNILFFSEISNMDTITE